MNMYCPACRRCLHAAGSCSTCSRFLGTLYTHSNKSAEAHILRPLRRRRPPPGGSHQGPSIHPRGHLVNQIGQASTLTHCRTPPMRWLAAVGFDGSQPTRTQPSHHDSHRSSRVRHRAAHTAWTPNAVRRRPATAATLRTTRCAGPPACLPRLTAASAANGASCPVAPEGCQTTL